MKKFQSAIILCAVSLMGFVSGCAPETPEEEPFLIVGSVSPVGYEETIVTLNVNCNVAYDVIVPSDVLWIEKCEEVNQLRILENTTTSSRNASVEVRTEDRSITKTIRITQRAHPDFDVELSFPQEVYEAKMEEEFEAPVLNNPMDVEVVYSSSREDVAVVDAVTGAVTLQSPGTTVIKASFNGAAGYNPAEASYTLNVTAASYIIVGDMETVPCTGGEITVPVDANVDYEIRIPEEASGWISAGGARDRLIINPNGEPEERSAVLSVVNDELSISREFTLVQAENNSLSPYDLWNKGYDIEIGGVKFNKSAYGEAQLINGTTPLGADGGVYFLDKGGILTMTWSNYTGSVIIVSNVEGERPQVNLSHAPGFVIGDGETAQTHFIAYKGVEISMADKEGGSTEFIGRGTGAIGSVIIDGCRLNLNYDFVFREKNNKTMEDFILVNNDILVMNDNDGRGRSIVQNWNGAGYSHGSFTARNNVVWSAGEPLPFHFIDCKYGSGIQYGNVVVENNILYNVSESASSGFENAMLTSVNSVTGGVSFRNNLAFTPDPKSKGDADQRYFGFFRVKGMTIEQTNAVMEKSGNWSNYPQSCYLYASDGKDWMSSISTGFTLDSDNKTLASWVNPFESFDVNTGAFTLKPGFEGYGPAR